MRTDRNPCLNCMWRLKHKIFAQQQQFLIGTEMSTSLHALFRQKTNIVAFHILTRFTYPKMVKYIEEYDNVSS